MTKTISELINAQINREFYSAFLYLDMAIFYAEKGLDGFENWFRIQFQEEQSHAFLMLDYLHANGESVVLQSIAKPSLSFENLIDPLDESLKHEQFVTECINELYQQATNEKDFRTLQFLNWFVKEQGEEEKNMVDLIQKMKLYGQDAKALYMLNAELGARVYVPPVLT